MYLTLSLFPMEYFKLQLDISNNPAIKESPFQVDNIPMRIKNAQVGKVLDFLGTSWRTWSKTRIFIECHLLKFPQRDPINFTIKNLIKNNNLQVQTIEVLLQKKSKKRQLESLI